MTEMTKFGEMLGTLADYEDSWTYSTTGYGKNKREWLHYKQGQRSHTYKSGKHMYTYNYIGQILSVNVTSKFDFDVGSSSVLSLEDKRALWDKFEALRVKKGGPPRVDDEFNMKRVQERTRTGNRNRLFKKIFNEVLGIQR